jgi:sensor histidine kinase regulating citrate/malate metabolism
MKHYKVSIKSTVTFDLERVIEVEADDEDEANDNAIETAKTLSDLNWIDEAINNTQYETNHEVLEVKEE